MEPLAINLATPFHSRAIFWPSGHTMPIRGLSNAGAAYLYQLEANGSATYLTKVTAPDGADDDGFGRSVSQSGNILAVGAHYADPGGLSNAGAAYLFQLEANGSATYLTKVTAPDGAATDYFGSSVSQSGNILAVGAYLADPGGLSDAGATYLFQLEANGSATYLNKVTASDGAAGDKFGISVSQSGNILAVGAYYADPGGYPQMPGQSIPLIWLDFLNFRKKLPLPMEPPAINLDTPFPSRAIFWPSGHTMPIRGTFQCWSCLSLSIGSQWIRYLPDQGNRSRWSRHRLFRILRFPVGQYSGRRGIPSRSGGTFQCRGCLSFSIGSQWIRYLPDQGNRSRWSRQAIDSESPFPSRAIFLPSGQSMPIRGSFPMPGLLIFINWKPMDPPPT